MEDIDKIASHAIEWAKMSGIIQLEYFRGNNLQIETKSNEHDVVTVVDKLCEKMFIENIAKHYPSHSVLGEETGEHISKGDYLWIIDPLDGTNNYSQGLPVYCVSIGIQYKGETIIGVVFAPYLNELYTAVKGRGAFMNGKVIHISKKTNLNHSVLATGFPYDKDVNPDNNTHNVSYIIPKIRGLRRMGSAAYDLCCVAAGFLDGYWEFNLNVWDVCAGELIVVESGGIVTNYRDDRRISIVAGNPIMVEKVLEMLRSVKNTMKN